MSIKSKISYLLTGLWNTVFGYTFSLVLYNSLHSFMHILLISLIANVICISMSFITYKIFVFKTKENWLREYIRCYIIYGIISLVSVVILWISVDFFKTPFWIAQGLLIPIMILFSYIGHKKFTFNVTG
jgi:putative flippase GtrA